MRFFVHGTPGPQGSKSYKGMRTSTKTGRQVPILTESSSKVTPWRTVVAQIAALKRREVLDGPVSVEVEFILHRPTSLPKRIVHMIRKPDLDKLVRSTLDALSEVAYTDDNRVTRIVATKRYVRAGEQTGAHILVEPSTEIVELMSLPSAQGLDNLDRLTESGWHRVGEFEDRCVFARSGGGAAA